MALVSVITAPEGAEYDQAVQIVGTMGLGTDARLNGVKMVSEDGRTWYGYDYHGKSWWVTKSMAAEHPDNDPFEFAGQDEPEI